MPLPMRLAAAFKSASVSYEYGGTNMLPAQRALSVKLSLSDLNVLLNSRELSCRTLVQLWQQSPTKHNSSTFFLYPEKLRPRSGEQGISIQYNINIISHIHICHDFPLYKRVASWDFLPQPYNRRRIGAPRRAPAPCSRRQSTMGNWHIRRRCKVHLQHMHMVYLNRACSALLVPGGTTEIVFWRGRAQFEPKAHKR